MIALCATAWSVTALLSLNNASKLDAVATRILSGEAFDAATLVQFMPELDAAERREPCSPLELHSATIVRLRLYEEAVNASTVTAADERFRALRTSTEIALKCVPTDSFLWFIRYWTSVAQGGNSANQIENLAMSYRLGRNEAWIALRRNAYALTVHDILPTDIAAMARAEFASLVDSGFISVAAQNLRVAGWPIRDQLISELANVRPTHLLILDRLLRDEGIMLAIPRVPQREFRPWRN